MRKLLTNFMAALVVALTTISVVRPALAGATNGAATAANPAYVSQTLFSQNGLNTTLTAGSGSSSNTTLPGATTDGFVAVTVPPGGTAAAHIRFGTSAAVSATTGDYTVPAGATVTIPRPLNVTYVSAIMDSGSSVNLTIASGNGGPLTGFGGGSAAGTGGGGGSYPADNLTTGNIGLTSTTNAFVVSLSNGEGIVAWAVKNLTGTGATLEFQGSNDGGTTWTPIAEVSNFGTGAAPTADITADGQYRITGTGHTKVRLAVVIAGTGTASVAANASTQSGNADSIAAINYLYMAQLQPGMVEGITPVGQSSSDIPIAMGCNTQASANTNTAGGVKANVLCDPGGRQIVIPYAMGTNHTYGSTLWNGSTPVAPASATYMTGTAAVVLLPAPPTNWRNYITNISCSNTSTSTSTIVYITDGSGGNIMRQLSAGMNYAGEVFSDPAGLRQPTAATAVYAQNATTGASVACSASGFILPE